MFYENISEFINSTINDSALKVKISDILNNSIYLLGVIFCVWFLFLIIFSVIRKSLQFGAGAKFTETGKIKTMNIPTYAVTTNTVQDAKYRMQFDAYCREKNIKSGNFVSKVVFQMYADGRNKVQAPPEKYTALMKSKINVMCFNKYISVVFTLILFMFMSPNYLTDNTGAVIFFALIEIFFALAFAKFLEKKANLINGRIYSEWYDALCRRENFAAQSIAQSEKNISETVIKFAEENKTYIQNAEKIARAVENLNGNIINIDQSIRENSGNNYEALCKDLLPAIDRTANLIESYKGFASGFETQINELSRSVAESGQNWENARNVASSLAAVNDNLDIIKTNSNTAVANVLEMMRKDVTSKVEAGLNTILGNMQHIIGNLETTFTQFIQVCQNYTDAVNKDPTSAFRQELIINQKNLVQQLTNIIQKSKDYEKVVSVFTGNTKKIIELATAMEKWQEEPKFLKKWKNRNAYKALLESGINNAETYHKIIEISDSLTEIKNYLSDENEGGANGTN